MTPWHDPALQRLLGGVFALLIVSSIAGFALSRSVKSERGRATVMNMNARIRAWWVMCLVFGAAVMTGGTGSLVLFAFLSLLALREYMTIAPTKPGDAHIIFWSFFLFTPMQYYFIWLDWYGLYSIFLPVYALIFIAVISAASGDTEAFLERTGVITWGLMACVYCLSFAPALLKLQIPGYTGNAKLLLFLVMVGQISDVFQYIWGKTLGKHPIAPKVSPNKTWEGFIGGVATATLVGAAIWWATPFTPLIAGAMALAIALLGFAGGLIMSAIKRDRGVKDFGAIIEGHGGVLDRIDSLCFSAPVFFHLTRYFYA
jgi:phosphatidate cytidylyltransferase